MHGADASPVSLDPRDRVIAVSRQVPTSSCSMMLLSVLAASSSIGFCPQPVSTPGRGCDIRRAIRGCKRCVGAVEQVAVRFQSAISLTLPDEPAPRSVRQGLGSIRWPADPIWCERLSGIVSRKQRMPRASSSLRTFLASSSVQS